jgi:acyl carrier protein
MSDKTTIQRLTDIIVEQLGVNTQQVTPDAKFIEDLNCDSLDAVELVMAIEDEFAVEVSDGEAEKALTVGAAVELVERLVSRNEG